jgi:hypothetical protein
MDFPEPVFGFGFNIELIGYDELAIGEDKDAFYICLIGQQRLVSKQLLEKSQFPDGPVIVVTGIVKGKQILCMAETSYQQATGQEKGYGLAYLP